MTATPFQHVARTFPTIDGGSPPSDRIRRGRKRLERFQWFVEDAIPLPVVDTKIGADAILGLIPVAGDALSAILQSYLLLEAMHLGVDGKTITKMAGNIAFDFVLGWIPVVGDLIDLKFKATRRNVRLVLDALGETDAA